MQAVFGKKPLDNVSVVVNYKQKDEGR